MSTALYIARRYLFAKKSHHAINIISAVSAIGVAIATAAMVCILSVFNGFQDMVANLFTSLDPQLKIVPVQGKYMAADEPALKPLHSHPDIEILSATIEDNALVMINNRQTMVVIKGVDENFEHRIDFGRIATGQGQFLLRADIIDYGIAGASLLAQLGIDEYVTQPLQIYAPRRGERIDLNDPSESFNNEELYLPQTGFSVHQPKYDGQYIITSLGFASRIFERQGFITAYELKLRPGADTDRVKADLQEAIGADYRISDRYEQQEDTFRIIQVEKLISFFFLTFILTIASFNIIGSISMLIIDKRADAATLRALGADDHTLRTIFMLEGSMISAAGAIAGILLGLTLCLLQQQFGLIRFGNGDGNYIIDAYPVSVHVLDLLIIGATVVVVGILSVWYPVRRLVKTRIQNTPS